MFFGSEPPECTLESEVVDLLECKEFDFEFRGDFVSSDDSLWSPVCGCCGFLILGLSFFTLC